MQHFFTYVARTGLVTVIALGGCNVKKTQDGELPEVDVKSGQLPEYEVETAEVEIGTEKKEIEVPDVDVDVDMKKTEIKVPDIDIKMPNDKETPEVVR